MRETKTVIEFGTSKIACSTAMLRDRGGLEILGYVSKPYSGIKDSNWVDPSQVGYVIANVIDELEKQTALKIKILDLSLPATLSDLHIETVSSGINGVVLANDLDNLFSMAAQFRKADNYKVVNQYSAWYMLEDGELFVDAFNKRTTSISAGIVSVLANKYLIEDLEILTRRGGVSVQGIICEQLAQSLALIPEEKRDTLAVLIDVGYYSTSISLVYGDAVLKTFILDVGGGYLTEDIAYNMKIDKNTAEKLKRQYSFGLIERSDIAYLFAKTSDGVLRKYPYALLKKIIDSRMEHMIRQIMLNVAGIEKNIGKKVSLYITGGGFSYMPGITGFFQSICGRAPVQCKVSNTKLNDPSMQSMYAALEYSLNSSDDSILFHEEEMQQVGFMDKLKSKFFK